MTIRTQQSQVPIVSRPIVETSRPSVLPILWVNLLGWVYVINIKCAEIIISTDTTLTAKRIYKRKFSFPITAYFMFFVTVFVPICFLAQLGAVTILTWFVALFTFSSFSPPVFEIARLIAKLSSAVFNTVRVHLSVLSAVFTRDGYFVSFHNLIITQNMPPKYFDIACERISAAYAQGRLFA